jgi:proteasome accessory factor B
MDKIERLLSVMNLLLGAPAPLSADTIRRRVPGYPDEEASWKRAFERDKDELREMGVPLLLEPIPGSDPPLVGYRIRQRDYELRDPGLEPDELEALNLAAAVTGLAGGLGQRAIFKLGGGAADAPEAELPADPNLVAAFTGVADRRALTFTYHGVERSVHPYRLEFVRGRWYLNGFDATRGDDRWFRLDRVEGDVVAGATPGAFERPAEAVPGLQLDPWAVGGSEEPLDAEVWFDPAVAHTVLRHLEPEAVVSSDDSGLVVRVRVTNREGFRDWVISFLDRAEVRSPHELRDLVVAWLEDVVATSGGGDR